MAERFGPDWPALRELGEQLATARAQLEQERAAIAEQVRQVAENEDRRVRAEVERLARRVEEQKSQVKRLHLETVEYTSLKSEIETGRTFLNELVGRQSETEMSDRLRDTQTSNVNQVDAAELPEWPVSPQKLKNLLAGLLFGLLLGIGAALLLDHLDYTVKNEQDVERLTGLPALGRIPLLPQLKVVGGGPVLRDHVGVGSHRDAQSGFAEAFKTLRTSILLASPERPPRHIVITSCEPGDGKSTVATNLAIVLTQLGRRVLLVDADLRNPSVHKTLGLANQAGLSNLLTGNARLAELQRECEVPNLRIVTSGPIPPTPSELLGSPALGVVLERADEGGEFDHVILDCPPALQVTDSVILATRADATVLVVRCGKTAREAVGQGAARMRQARAHVVGVVMNAVPEAPGYYYGAYRAAATDDPAEASPAGERRHHASAG
jgi:capsular exopolysaccharide synthesis family protein